MGFLTDEKGNKSSMRLAMMLSVVTGCFTVVLSVIGMFLNVDQAVTMATVGAGMVVAAQGWKAMQHKQEGHSIEVRRAE
jgi:sulfate adenylyltransferase subunit 1 (EFTu-like GTPase family)